MQTPIITYNLKERGRKYRGQDRNFDTVKLAAYINGGECQERVKNRDMLGFYGHWPRIKFGMNPAEGGIVDGKATVVEPAIVTTMLKAHRNGTIEHQAEFLPTQSGMTAQTLWKAKTGGFSSAINQATSEFFGFDYVHEPNYTTNRGFSFDSALCAGGACALGMNCADLDLAILEEQLSGVHEAMSALMDGNAALDSLLAAAKKERAALMRVLKKQGMSQKQIFDAMSDKAKTEAAIKPLRLDSTHAQAMLREAQAFRDFELPGMAKPAAKPSPEDSDYLRMAQVFLG